MNNSKIPFFIISGASGVGKSTLLRTIAQSRDKTNFIPIIPQKITTRPKRIYDAGEEITHVDRQKFESMKASGSLLADYDDHGFQYGLVKPVDLKLSPETVLFQCLPSKIGFQLRKKFADEYDFHICRLEADPSIIHLRLRDRGDNIGVQEATSRLKTAFKETPEDIDLILDASGTVEAIFSSFSSLVQKTINSSLLHYTHITPLEEKIIECLLKACADANTDVCIFGGLAANFHGSRREITDIDFLVHTNDLRWLFEKLRFEEIELTEKMISVGRIDIRKSPVRIGNAADNQFWDFSEETLKRLISTTFKGQEVTVLSAEDMIIMKASLQRGEDQGKFDLFDLKNMTIKAPCPIDFSYIIQKSRESRVLDRVIAGFEKAGLVFPKNIKKPDVSHSKDIN